MTETPPAAPPTLVPPSSQQPGTPASSGGFPRRCAWLPPAELEKLGLRLTPRGLSTSDGRLVDGIDGTVHERYLVKVRIYDPIGDSMATVWVSKATCRAMLQGLKETAVDLGLSNAFKLLTHALSL